MDSNQFFDTLREFIVSEQKKKGRRTDKTRLDFAEKVVLMVRGFFGEKPGKVRPKRNECMVKIDTSKVRGPGCMVDDRGVARMDERHSSGPNDPVVK